jgi:hypothetical protein
MPKWITLKGRPSSTPLQPTPNKPNRKGGQEEHATFHGSASFHGEDLKDKENFIYQAKNLQGLEGHEEDGYCEDFSDKGEFGMGLDNDADEASEGLVMPTPVTPITQSSLSTNFSNSEARLVRVVSNPAHHQPDPMGIELANTIASARKQYTPAKTPNPRSTSSEQAAWPSGSLEPFLPGPPA